MARSQRHDLIDLPDLVDLPDMQDNSNYTTSTAAAAMGASNAAKPSSSDQSLAGHKRRRDRDSPVDWSKFYGGQPPKEIIVIDDTPEPDTATTAASHPDATAAGTSNGTNTTYTYTNGTANSNGANTSAARHAPKRRKRDDDVSTTSGTRYDPVHSSRINNENANANARRNQAQSQSASIISSASRTDSAIHTTAATSLGSLGSRSSNGHYDLDAQVGQKRKRTTRQQAANEVKRRENAITGHNYPSYHPPPNPPKKAGDVYVRVIQDVRLLFRVHCNDVKTMFRLTKPSQKHKNTVVDSEDGHYNVLPDAELTDNCG